MERVLLSLGGSSFTVPAAASLVTALLVMGLGGRVLLREQRAEESGRRRRQLRLLQVAFLIGGLAIVDFLPSFRVDVPPVGYLFVLGGLLIPANAVQRHRLVELTPSFTADTILRTMSDPVVVIEEDGSIRFASEAVRETFGWSPDRLRDAGWEALLDGEAERGVLRRLVASDGPSDGAPWSWGSG